MEWLLVAVVGIALVFDYTNGFHDAANAVATSISTRVPPNVALRRGALERGGALDQRRGDARQGHVDPAP
jgi:PiT family inorganic phosphate transporter